MTVPIEITRLEKSHGPITKSIFLGSDGKPFSDSSPCYLLHGWGLRLSVDGLSGLADLIPRLEPNHAIALGTLRADLPDRVEIVTEAARRRLDGSAPQVTIARTRTFIDYRPGQPAFVLLDFDRKGMPPEVAERIDGLGGVWSAIVSAC
jgi:hypothetical protein